jgi:tetratricopeptide (TPR) repeat protein
MNKFFQLQNLISLGLLLGLMSGCGGQAEKHYNRGKQLQEEGNLNQAVEAFRLATQAEPDFAPAYRELGALLLNLKRPQEAIDAYLKLVELKPGQPENHLLLAQAQEAAGRAGQALRTYERALKLAPESTEAHYRAGALLVEQQRFAEARSILLKALELDPERPGTHRSLADALYFLKRHEEAAQHFEKAISLGDESADIYTRYGLALEQLDRREEAITALQEALKQNPEDTDALRYLGQLYWYEEQWQKVVEYWTRLLQIDPDDRLTEPLLEEAERKLAAKRRQ